MGIYIDKVDVYCDGCDAKAEMQLADGSLENGMLNWFDEVTDKLPSWNLYANGYSITNGVKKCSCPNCLDKQEELEKRKEELEEVIQKLEGRTK